MSKNANQKPRKIRNQPIELLRVISAFGIVAYHAHVQNADLTYSGLIVFLAISPMIDVWLGWDKPRNISQLAQRLLLPWLFWMTVYAILSRIMHNAIFPSGMTVSTLLLGTSQHLWFLPFMFFVLVTLNWIKPRFPPKNVFWFSVTASTILLAFAVQWRGASLMLPPPLPQWAHASAAIFAGIALGLAPRNGRLAFVGLAVMSLGLASAISANLVGLSVPYAVGLAMIAVAAWVAPKFWPVQWRVQPIADCMMGVYLTHIAVLGFVYRVAAKTTYASAVLTFCIALAGVWTARRLFPISKMVLG